MEQWLSAITVLMTEEEACKAIGERITLMRTRKELSHSELAKLSGVSIKKIEQAESCGEISLANLLKIARAMSNTDSFGAVDQMLRSPQFKKMDEFLAYWDGHKQGD